MSTRNIFLCHIVSVIGVFMLQVIVVLCIMWIVNIVSIHCCTLDITDQVLNSLFKVSAVGNEFSFFSVFKLYNWLRVKDL